MMLTEAEAREKWCPFANVYVPYQYTGAAGNRGLDPKPDAQAWKGKAKCIASRCMAWRWTEVSAAALREFDTNRLGSRQEVGVSVPSNRLVGYCGLAGHP